MNPINDNNIILDTDSYKSSHFMQYPPSMTRMMSYLESRGGTYPATRFFGLQYVLKKYLSTHVTLEMVEEANAVLSAHGEPFPLEAWRLIATELGGKLPLEIRAVPEGTLVPNHNVLLTCTNTDERFPWLVSWFETMLMRVWYPTTVATQSYYIKKVIQNALEETSDDPSGEIAFKLHDFGSRGVSSRESAGIGGLAHLLNFMGTDTLEALRVARNYYHSETAGFSIPAAEHSTVTSWGKENELEAYRHAVKMFAKPGALFAVVSDSYDLKNAINHFWGEALREQIISSGATLVVRPDSGDPPAVVRMAVKALDAKFGHKVNSKGYKVLNHVRVIQGDGINEESIKEILAGIINEQYSATNVGFGMGGALLQKVDRDTQRFAYKASAGIVGGVYRPIYKDPVTDPRKRSKDGVLDLVLENGKFRTMQYTDFAVPYPNSAMRTVFKNGEVLVEDTLEQIRSRA